MNKNFLIGYKLFFAFLGFGSIVTEIAVTAERGALNLANFLSYLTIQTNIIVFLTLVLSAIAIAANKQEMFNKLRTAATIYILIVGIGFYLLLSNLENAILTAVPWNNTILHYIIPIAMFMDMIIDPPKRPIKFQESLKFLLFPVAYLVYSLIRGAIISWYPYPFLNPVDGYTPVLVTALGVTILSVAITWVVTKLSQRKF